MDGIPGKGSPSCSWSQLCGLEYPQRAAAEDGDMGDSSGKTPRSWGHISCGRAALLIPLQQSRRLLPHAQPRPLSWTSRFKKSTSQLNKGQKADIPACVGKQTDLMSHDTRVYGSCSIWLTKRICELEQRLHRCYNKLQTRFLPEIGALEISPVIKVGPCYSERQGAIDNFKIYVNSYKRFSMR